VALPLAPFEVVLRGIDGQRPGLLGLLRLALHASAVQLERTKRTERDHERHAHPDPIRPNAHRQSMSESGSDGTRVETNDADTTVGTL